MESKLYSSKRSNYLSDNSHWPIPWQNLKPYNGSDPCRQSPIYNIQTSLKRPIIEAVLAYAKGSSSEICLIEIGEGSYCSEWFNPDTGTTILAQANRNGKIMAAEVTDTGEYRSITGLGNPSNTFDSRSILLLYIMIATTLKGNNQGKDLGRAAQVMEQDLEYIRKWFTKYLAGSSSTDEDDGSVDALYRINDCVQAMLNDGHVKSGVGTGNLLSLKKDTVDAGTLSGIILCGKPVLLDSVRNAAAKKKVPQTIAEGKKYFEAYSSQLSWTDEQKKHIYSFPDTFRLPPEVFTIANRFVMSRGLSFGIDMNNYNWVGFTGCGKSTGVEMLSCILNTPLYKMTCDSNMKAQDFKATLVPVSADERTAEELPDMELMYRDPELAYELITGESKPGVTQGEVLAAYVAAVGGNDGTKFKLVKSNYIKALEEGCICEIQECSRIKETGALVGLNETDHAGAVIQLIDGSTTVRHPNALTVWTDNIGYASCRPIDQSVKRRFKNCLVTRQFDQEEIVSRTMGNTNRILDEGIVRLMYKAWEQAKKYCAEEEITEGDISVTDLDNWVACVAIDGFTEANVEATFRECVINKVSTDLDTVDAVFEASRLVLEQITA